MPSPSPTKVAAPPAVVVLLEPPSAILSLVHYCLIMGTRAQAVMLHQPGMFLRDLMEGHPLFLLFPRSDTTISCLPLSPA